MNINNIIITELDGIDSSDYPDFCDAYITGATWKNGLELTQQQLDDLSENQDVYQDLIQSYIAQGGLS